jgi:crotonobetainyl-CoA:carnitine CoA-transferase CaiB-like acyl-CoA transferase
MARWCDERRPGPVLSPQQALDHPHIRAAGFMQEVDYPGLPKSAPVARAVVRLSETPGEMRHARRRSGSLRMWCWWNWGMRRRRLRR